MIVNLTQHNSSAEQAEEGVVDLQGESLARVRELLTFSELPTGEEIKARAEALAGMAKGFDSAMIGGAPYLMAALEAALLKVGVTPLYAFSRRESVDSRQEDGSIIKHGGIPPPWFCPRFAWVECIGEGTIPPHSLDLIRDTKLHLVPFFVTLNVNVISRQGE